jgi:hypothetical protein
MRIRNWHGTNKAHPDLDFVLLNLDTYPISQRLGFHGQTIKGWLFGHRSRQPLAFTDSTQADVIMKRRPTSSLS